MDEKEILVSLGDDRIKEIAEVVSNKTCNKILDLLTESEMTPTEISNKLKIPLNTTDYNLKKLVKSGLIEKASKWWSVKGKRINSYKVSNKKIIISPKKSIAKTFILTLGLTGIGSFIIKKLMNQNAPIVMLKETVVTSVRDDVAVESFAMNPQASDAIVRTVTNTNFWQNLNAWDWFLFGAWAAILIFFILTIYNERKPKGIHRKKINNLIERRSKK